MKYNFNFLYELVKIIILSQYLKLIFINFFFIILAFKYILKISNNFILNTF